MSIEAADVPFTMLRGTDIHEQFTFLDEANNIIDVSLYTIVAKYRDGTSIFDNEIGEFTIDMSEAANGIIYLDETDTNTTLIIRDKCYYDIAFTSGSFTEVWVDGLLTIGR